MRILATLIFSAVLSAAATGQCPQPSHLDVVKGDYAPRAGVSFKLENFVATMQPRSSNPPDCWNKVTDIQHGRVLVNADSLNHLFQEKVQGPADGKSKNDQGSNDKSGDKNADKNKDNNKKDSKDNKDSASDKDKNQKDAKNDSGGDKDSGKKSDKDSGKKKDDKSPSITDVNVRMEDNQLVISGKAHKVVPIPFELKGPVDAVSGGRWLRFHVQKVKAEGLEVKGLLGAFGMNVATLLKSEQSQAVQVKDQDILFDPQQLSNFKGTISRAQIANNVLVVDFASPGKNQPTHKPARHVAAAVAGHH